MSTCSKMGLGYLNHLYFSTIFLFSTCSTEGNICRLQSAHRAFILLNRVLYYFTKQNRNNKKSRPTPTRRPVAEQPIVRVRQNAPKIEVWAAPRFFLSRGGFFFTVGVFYVTFCFVWDLVFFNLLAELFLQVGVSSGQVSIRCEIIVKWRKQL